MQVSGNFNPFPGLRPFDEEEDYLFFGREQDVDALLKRLRSNRFLAVIGWSGSGKSSLVRSGIIPALHSGYMVQAGSSWRVAIMHPGADPIGNLSDALSQHLAVPENAEQAATSRMLIETTLRRSNLGLADCIRQARLPAGENFVLVVDQFEELFRFKRSRRNSLAGEEAVAFVKRLLLGASQQDVAVYVVITMRSDFIGDCMEYPGLPEAINEGQYLVPRMTRSQLRLAISGPAAVGGGEISARLVTKLLNEVGDDPDQLPVLQHALMRTWDCWMSDHAPGESMDLRHYEAIGTMREALSRHAEEAYASLASDRARGIAEKLFKALTDTASDARGIRRATSVADLAEIALADQSEVGAVIDSFRMPGRSFLMPPSEVALTSATIVDISHESLMRVWRRLLDWAKDERRACETYLQLAQAAARHEQGTAGLWRDPELQLALAWREKTRPSAAWARQYAPAFERTMRFLDLSKAQRDLEIAEKERLRRNKLRVAGAIGSVLLVLTLYAFFQESRAKKAQQQAEYNLQLATQAVDSMLTEVGKKSLADVPQMEEIRQDLLEKARVFYNMFQQQKPTDPSLRLRTALAHSRLGDIYRLQGQNDPAEKAYNTAIEQLTALRSESSDREYTFQLAGAYNRLGEQLRPHHSAGAENAYDRALALQKELVLRFPDLPEYALELALIYNNRGILLAADTTRAADAESSYRAAIATFEKLTSNRDDRAALFRLAQTYNNLGSLLRQTPDQQANAETSYRKAIEVMEGLRREQPNRREYKEELAKFYNNLGNFRVLRREFEPALVANQRALELFEELAAPVRGISNELANGYNSRGLILQQLSQAPGGTKTRGQREAVEAYLRSIQIFANLERGFKDFAQDSDAKARYGNALANLGRLRMESGDLKEAMRLLKLAVTHYSGALSSRAPRSDYQRNLAGIYWMLAESQLLSGDLVAAAEAGELSTRTLPAQESYYRAARILTRAAELAQGPRSSAGEKREQLRRSYTTRAIRMLEHAVALGYSTERLQSEAGAAGPFHPLRDEPAFRKLLGTNNTGSS